MTPEWQRLAAVTRFARVEWVVFCEACMVVMPGERWPSHYRTKAHRLKKIDAATIVAHDVAP